MVFNLYFMHSIYAIARCNSFDGYNNRLAGNMSFGNSVRCRVEVYLDTISALLFYNFDNDQKYR